MIFTVVSKIMPVSQNRLYIIRIAFHPAPCHEKRHVYLMLFQNFQYPGCILISPGSVKGQGNLRLLRFHTVNGKLPPVHRTACEKALSGIYHNSPDCGKHCQYKNPILCHPDQLLLFLLQFFLIIRHTKSPLSLLLLLFQCMSAWLCPITLLYRKASVKERPIFL